ncbi:hypothetical protein CMU89_00655 [Elizabethkingia anophelis]|jgi:hypothetical protein|uniref:hypothetical protein n=1 Tax=Elizabethkingia TaxID=308865 RepID=UPI000C6DA4F5|nr:MULTISPECIES: hypothetical protein [Elizabethkingia]MCL1665778.1 hypothetical protein [Elizabethkingia ursingii]MDV3508345.1 hypothetical protein [Elizabethkingia anophelis]MDV3541181.1 hypothetical protein [Elizabethkingia anophelis]PKR31550.1 hypothetical protein CWH99_12360 [Elizabethkingia anophelis]PKR33841.1 hypothetical protein CWI00_17025 [Elizabethkingia anophelis]
MLKTIFIPAHFKPIIEDVAENVPTGETKKNWLGSEKQITKKTVSQKIVGWSNSEIDGERLSADINDEIEKWSSQNIKIISISPITSGRYNYQYSSQGISSSRRVFSETEKVSGGGSYGFGYGYSYTEGVLICIQIL